MPAQQKAPLRSLSPQEYQELQRIIKASSERLDRVRRARALLAVTEGQPYTQASPTLRLLVRPGSRVGIV
jgi:hypothetical protein